MSSRLRLGTSLTLGAALLAACGGSPTQTTGAGAANLPPQTNPGVADKDKNKTNTADGPKKNLKGTIVDALTGEPLDKAMLFIQGMETTMKSTPIPAAPSPGPDEIDDPTGSGGGGGPAFQVAQVTDPTIPDAETTISPSPAASGLLASPGASGSPGASTSPGASASPGAAAASASPAGGPAVPGMAGSTPAPDKSGAPTAMGTPYPASAYKIDSRGRFELKDLPEGTYNMTFWAPGYQATTIVASLPDELNVTLRPIDFDAKQLHEMKGVVKLSDNTAAAADVDVEVSSVAGKLPGGHEATDANGNFSLKGLYSGNYAVAAWTTSLEGEVETFALMKEVPVSLGRERRTVSPTLVMRAVTTPVLLAGTVEGSAKEAEIKAALAEKKPVPGIRPVSVRAYIAVGDGEIPIATANVGKDGYFRMRLPQLPEGATYHVVASGQSDTGQTAYVHEYEVEASDPKMAFKLPAAPEPALVLDRTKHPRFSWEPVGSDVSAYRVALEKVGQDGDTIWEGWTTGTAMNVPDLKELTLLREGESYRYSLSAVKLADEKKLDLLNMAGQPWASSGITKPATFEVVRLKPGQKAPSSAPVKPLPTPAGTTAPKPAPKASGAAGSPKPSVKPTPTNSRIKPIDDI